MRGCCRRYRCPRKCRSRRIYLLRADGTAVLVGVAVGGFTSCVGVADGTAVLVGVAVGGFTSKVEGVPFGKTCFVVGDDRTVRSLLLVWSSSCIVALPLQPVITKSTNSPVNIARHLIIRDT